MAQLPASHGSWVPRSGCKCVGSGTWHVQPESFTCAGHVRITRYCACLRFGVQGSGRRVRRGHSETTTCTTVYMCTTLGLYLQRRDTRKYAQMYTGKVFVTAGRGDAAGRVGTREGVLDRVCTQLRPPRMHPAAPRTASGVAGSGYDRQLGNKYKSARAFKHRAQLTRAAAVSPHMHVKDYITASKRHLGSELGAQAACFADSTTADASVSAQGGF